MVFSWVVELMQVIKKNATESDYKLNKKTKIKELISLEKL